MSPAKYSTVMGKILKRKRVARGWRKELNEGNSTPGQTEEASYA
jgi:hypothetical protein